MEPPSDELRQALATLPGVDRSALRRCVPWIRRWSRGLPIPDSIWLDALVRDRAITRAQADYLEQQRGNELLIADRLVLRTPLCRDSVLPTWEAIDRRTGGRCVVSRASCKGREADVHVTLRAWLGRWNVRAGSLPTMPLDVVAHDGAMWWVQTAASGQPLRQLLVRRGRFPEPVVAGLAAELARQLEYGEATFPHGDLRLSNVLLAEQGVLHLLNWGVLAALWPVRTWQTPLPADAAEGLAPERIEGDEPATIASDVYSLGCLLWELLAGRPPFLCADPLGKLRKQKTQIVPDVRTIAFDASEQIALLIRAMTAREPHRRPQSFGEVREVLRRQRTGHAAAVRTFVNSFARPAPSPPSPETVARWRNLAAAVALSALAAGAAWNRESLGLPGLSHLTAATIGAGTARENFTPFNPTEEGASETPTGPFEQWLPLPEPDEHGLITLTPGGRYQQTDLTANAVLTLQGDPDRPATIRLQAPCRWRARRISMENVWVRFDAAVEAPLLTVQTEDLTLNYCWFGPDPASTPVTSPTNSVFVWTPSGYREASWGQLLIADVVFDGHATLTAQQPLGSGLLQNVLKTGAGPLLSLQAGVRSGWKVPLVLNQTTCRTNGPCVAVTDASSSAPVAGRLSLQGEGTVIAAAEGSAVLEWQGDLPEDWTRRLEIAARSWILEEGATLLGHRPQRGPLRELDSATASIDGVIVGRFHFDESIDEFRKGAVITDELPIFSPGARPGADPARQLPAP